jgi:hypothetical protein
MGGIGHTAKISRSARHGAIATNHLEGSQAMRKAAKLGRTRRQNVFQVFLDDMVETGDLEIAPFTRNGKLVYHTTEMSSGPSAAEVDLPGEDRFSREALARLTESEFQKLLADLKLRLREMRDLPN